MAIAVINYIRSESEEAFERIVLSFKNRARLVEKVKGFIGIEVLASKERREVLVITLWDSKESFDAWVRSREFDVAHRRARGDGSTSEGVIYDVIDMSIVRVEDM
ncbi:MAG: antibiotic biosynthesis monooxygenase [Desulfurococcales archaeon]|nr:antibiotic biosynthesis monooxygenase [Desulfurococcales archaeon]